MLWATSRRGASIPGHDGGQEFCDQARYLIASSRTRSSRKPAKNRAVTHGVSGVACASTSNSSVTR